MAIVETHHEEASIPPTPPVSSTAQVSGHRLLPVGLTRGFSALHVRNYRLFIFGQIVSLSGTWMQTTAQAWLVLQLTNSPLALGTVTTLQFLPVTILALYGGVLADRLPKRRTLIVTQSLLLIQAVIFGALVATGTIQIWQIYILAIAQGIVSAIDVPVRQAFVVEMVGREDLVNAVALNSMTFNGARIIGPALGGAVIASFGVAPALYFNAISFVAVIAALFMMRPAELLAVPPAMLGSVSKRLLEGLAYVWHTPRLLIIFLVVATIGTFGYNFSVVLPLLATFVLHTNAAGFGALSSFFGVGSLIAALSTAYVRHVTMKRLFIGAGAFSIIFGIVGLITVFWLSALLLIALGVASIIFSTSSNTLLQLNVPDALRGRVMSLNVLLIMGSTPIGGYLVGAMSDRFGVPITLVTCAVLCMVGVVAALIYRSGPAYQQAISQIPHELNQQSAQN